jgi:hypothetical protein
MPPPQKPSRRLSKSIRNSLVRIMEGSTQRTFNWTDLTRLIRNEIASGALPWSLQANQAIAQLTEDGLTKVELEPASGTALSPAAGIIRYVWGSVSPYSVALTLRPNSYLSHGSAVLLHGLSALPSATVFVNKEQTAKPIPSTPPTQLSIDRAFAGAQRTSNYVLTYGGVPLCSHQWKAYESP